VISARDEGDYLLASGAALSFERSVGLGVDLTLGLRAERQRSVGRRAKSAVNDFFGGDGVFSPNPPIDEGDHLGVVARLDGLTFRSRWFLAIDGLSGGGDDAARVYGSLRQPMFGRRGVTVRAHAGVGTEPGLAQLDFRAGGQGSVRGFDYGAQRGQSLWAIQTDWSPLARRGVRPVLFVDAGQAGPIDQLGDLPVMVGGGAGVSALGGLVRLELSRRLTDHPALRAAGGWRVDLVFGAPR
jgi:hypothetical protein